MTPPSSPAPRAPSRELDAEIAERVMGWQRFPYILTSAFDDTGIVESWGSTFVTVQHCPPGEVHVSRIAKVPAYSTDIAAAWLVVEKLNAASWWFSLDYSGVNGAGEWLATFVEMDGDGIVDEAAATAPLAICLAALKFAPPRAPLEGE